jgi:hypothetical protein
MIKDIHYLVESQGNFENNLDVNIPGWDGSIKHDVVITQGSIRGVEYDLVRLFIARNQLDDLIFILGQAKKEYGLPE